MCILGGDYTVTYPIMAFLFLSISSILTAVVWATIVLDKATAVILGVIISVIILLQLLMCGFNSLWPGGTVDQRFEHMLNLITKSNIPSYNPLLSSKR